MTRFAEPITAETKQLSVRPIEGMETALGEMANRRGISRAELLRRIIARAIVDDARAPSTYAIELLADLWTP